MPPQAQQAGPVLLLKLINMAASTAEAHQGRPRLLLKLNKTGRANGPSDTSPRQYCTPPPRPASSGWPREMPARRLLAGRGRTFLSLTVPVAVCGAFCREVRFCETGALTGWGPSPPSSTRGPVHPLKLNQSGRLWAAEARVAVAGGAPPLSGWGRWRHWRWGRTTQSDRTRRSSPEEPAEEFVE